jgi:2,3-bisphosphoglycerate-independent phosphoglycerate mutase
MRHHDFLARLAQPSERKIVLLVLDGVGDLRTAAQPATALERAVTPNFDLLAARSALGRITPVAPGVTPGSGPGHLALFGYDPTDPEADIGRGVLEALGLDLEIRPGDVVARGNYATADAEGKLTDRRAGRPPTEEGRRLAATMQAAIDADPAPGVAAMVTPGEGHRFVLLLRGEGLSSAIADTDPQELGVEPLPPRAAQGADDDPAARATVADLEHLIAVMNRALAGEPKANRVLLRGFSRLPHLPPVPELYRLRCGAFAGYPLYRGVAAACGMELVRCGKQVDEVIDAVAARWADFDYFFLHVKYTDMAGEDGDLDAKVKVIEGVDAALPRLLALGPDVVAVTGDHSTPAPMKAHSWHPVPLLLAADHCFVDQCKRYTETEATRGHLGTFPSYQLMGLLLANAERLAKYGA